MTTNGAAAEAVYAHFRDPASGWAGVVAVLHDDVVYEAPYYTDFDPKVGKAELEAMFERVGSGADSFFSEQRFPSHSLLATEDPEIFLIEVTGDHGIRATGKRYRNHYLHHLQIRDGKIVRWREFSNPNVFREAVS